MVPRERFALLAQVAHDTAVLTTWQRHIHLLLRNRVKRSVWEWPVHPSALSQRIRATTRIPHQSCTGNLSSWFCINDPSQLTCIGLYVLLMVKAILMVKAWLAMPLFLGFLLQRRLARTCRSAEESSNRGLLLHALFSCLSEQRWWCHRKDGT